MMPFSSKASRSGSSLPGSSCWASAVTAKPRSSAPNSAWKAAIRSVTGPGLVLISSAALAMKDPAGNARRSRWAKNASHTAVSWARPGGAASAGETTSSAKIRAASVTVAS
jgi:hypothetical protein